MAIPSGLLLLLLLLEVLHALAVACTPVGRLRS